MLQNSNLRIVPTETYTTVPAVVINDVEFYYSHWEFDDIDFYMTNCDTSLLNLNVNSCDGISYLSHSNSIVNIHNCTLGCWRLECIDDVQITDCSIVGNPSCNSKKIIEFTNSSAILENILIENVNFDCPMNLDLEFCGVVVNFFSKIQISHSVFKKNKNVSISVRDYSDLLMENCTVLDNDVYIGVVTGWTSVVNILNSTFENNTRSKSGTIFMIELSTVTVNFSTFIHNHALSSGGGVSIAYGSTLVLSKSTFTNNTVDTMGGAVSVVQDSKLNILQSTFNGNTAPQLGGAIFVTNNSSLVCIGSNFSENIAKIAGSAIAVQTSNATMLNLMINQNHGEAALSFYSSYFANIYNCVFKRNAGGAMLVTGMIKLEVRNSDFFQNQASSGGAISVDYSENVTISHVRLFQNVARYGGAIEISKANVSIDNCILKDNVAVYDGGAVLTTTGNIDLSIRNSCFRNNTTEKGFGGALSINLARLFMSNCSGKHNYATRGGAIQGNRCQIKLEYCSFEHNTADQKRRCYVHY